MKNGKNLTLKEKLYLKSLRFEPKNWLISKKKTDEWVIVNRASGRIRVIPAP